MASPSTPIGKVLDKEIEAIHGRRRAADLEDYQEDCSAPFTLNNTRQSLVGLALSGGGVRSGALGLGLIQALCTAGRMRAIDFISTVSGGGYAGALFSAEVAKTNDEINWSRRPDSDSKLAADASDDRDTNDGTFFSTTNRLDIETHVDGRQPDRIKAVAMHGRMMGDFLKLLSRHLAGFLFTITFIISGIVACAAVLAIIMRLPYTRSVLPYLFELKFATDIAVPFFPAFIAFLIWIACLVISRTGKLLDRPLPNIVKLSYVLLMATTVLGVLAFFALGDVDVNSWTRQFGWPAEWQTTITSVVSWIATLLSGLFLTSLLPLLAPRRLLESGADDTKPFRKFVFNTSGWAVVIGLPLFLYFLLVHENVSGYTLKRPNADRFTESHVVNIDEFLLRLQAEDKLLAETKGPKTQVVANLLSVFTEPNQPQNTSLAETDQPENANQTVPKGDQTQLRSDVSKFLDAVKKRNDNEGKTWFVSAWLQAFCTPVSDRYLKRVRAIQDYDNLQQFMVDELTDEGLSNPWLIYPADAETDEDALASLGPNSVAGADEVKANKRTLTAFQQLKESQLQVKKLVAASVGNSERDIATDDLDKWYKLCLYKDGLELPSHTKRNSVSVYDDLVKPLENNQDEIDLVGLRKTIRKSELKKLVTKVRTSNWVLLNALYPEYFRPQDTTFAFVVNGPDQIWRGKIAATAIMIFVITGLVTNLNRTNLHGVYRDQLASTWLPEADVRLCKLDTCSKGAPLQLIQGTLNRMGTRTDPDAEYRSRFCMSYLYCGSKKMGYRPTEFYQGGRLSAADAIAISGAAVSAINTSGMLSRVLLFVTNFRLGQWLLNPVELKNDEYWPSPLVAMINWFRYPEQRKYLFVSDGGHLENTGMAALLERRCRLMILADASYDPEYKFTDVLKLLQDARAKYGIQVIGTSSGISADAADEAPLNVTQKSLFAPLRPNNDGFSARHFIVIEIQYTHDDRNSGSDYPATGLIILCKSSLTGDEVPELVELADKRSSFPHDKTSDQFLDSDRFETYLELGRHIGQSLDQFVCRGGLDKYDLALGWNSNQRQKDWGESGRTNANDSNGRSQATGTQSSVDVLDSIGNKYPFFVQLEDMTFDPKGIQQALKQMEELISERSMQALSEAVDDAEFEYAVQALSNWARGRGENADKAYRKQFCDGLVELIDKHIETIIQSPVVHLSFFQMLEFLGKRVGGVSKSLNRLAETVTGREVGDSQAAG